MKTINLLNEKDFQPILNPLGEIRYLELDSDISSILYQKLLLASKTGDLIYTQDLRGIGKTYELIEFAKHRGLSIVEPTVFMAHFLGVKYEYEHIYAANDTNLRDKDVVIDEGVNADLLLQQMNCKIIAGYSIEKIKHI